MQFASVSDGLLLGSCESADRAAASGAGGAPNWWGHNVAGFPSLPACLASGAEPFLSFWSLLTTIDTKRCALLP